MKVTIDKAGRLVVPKSLRERYHMYPGAVLEVEGDVEGIRIKSIGQHSSLVMKDGILIHHGSETVDIDIVSVIAQERNRRNADLVDSPDGR